MRTNFTLLFLSCSILSYGQFIQDIGIKTGICTANQTFEYKYGNDDNKFGTKDFYGTYSAISLEFLKSKYFKLATDIGFCQKGNRQDIAVTSMYQPEFIIGYKTYYTQFNYLTFSPQLKAKYETKYWIPYVSLGLRMDYFLSYKSDFNYSTLTTNEYNKKIWGLNLGAGIEYKINRFGIFAEYQYQYDFTKVVDTQPTANSIGVSITNHAFIIDGGLRYYLHYKKDTTNIIDTTKNNRRNLIYGQLLGDVDLVGLNYEYVYTNNSLINLSFRLGVGWLGKNVDSWSGNDGVILIGNNFLIGRHNLLLELGLNAGHTVGSSNTFLLTGNFGLRFQNRNKPRAFIHLIYNPILYSYDYISIVPVALGIGSSF